MPLASEEKLETQVGFVGFLQRRQNPRVGFKNPRVSFKNPAKIPGFGGLLEWGGLLGWRSWSAGRTERSYEYHLFSGERGLDRKGNVGCGGLGVAGERDEVGSGAGQVVSVPTVRARGVGSWRREGGVGGRGGGDGGAGLRSRTRAREQGYGEGERGVWGAQGEGLT